MIMTIMIIMGIIMIHLYMIIIWEKAISLSLNIEKVFLVDCYPSSNTFQDPYWVKDKLLHPFLDQYLPVLSVLLPLLVSLVFFSDCAIALYAF